METVQILSIILAIIGVVLAIRNAYLKYEILGLKDSMNHARELIEKQREVIDRSDLRTLEAFDQLRKARKENADVQKFEHNVRVGRHLIDGESHERRANVLQNALWDAYTKIGKVFVEKYATIRVLDHIHDPNQVFKATWESNSIEIRFLFSTLEYKDHESEKCHNEGTEIPKGNRRADAWFPTEVLSRIKV